MANEKYLNYYIETMTSTLTDCVVRNISMQANAKITDEVVKIEDVQLKTSENNHEESEKKKTKILG